MYQTGDGLIYEGEWKNGRQDGFGVFAWPDGSKYTGEWREGKQHGHGIWENGKVIHEGIWEKGKRTGLGMLKKVNSHVCSPIDEQGRRECFVQNVPG